mgnify:CR=1 FL=1
MPDIGEGGLTEIEKSIGLGLLRLWGQAGLLWRITVWPKRRGVKLALWALRPASDFSHANHPMRRWEHVWPDGTPGDGIMAPPYGVWEGHDASVCVPERLPFNGWRRSFELRLLEAVNQLELLVDSPTRREAGRERPRAGWTR